MSQVFTSNYSALKISLGESKDHSLHKLIHPRVLKATQFSRPMSPSLTIRDVYQPMRGDLKNHTNANFNLTLVQ